MAPTETIYDVRAFGAKGDGTAKDTRAIQAAIDACAAGAGGWVHLTGGHYLTGTLKLKSHVTLHLFPEAVLLGSTDLADYAEDIQGAVEWPVSNKCLLYAEEATNIAITGQGTIEGQGSAFPALHADGTNLERPMLFRFINCRHLILRDVELRNAASWCGHFVRCEEIKLEGVRLFNLANVNNDGFDFDGCSNVFITNCHLKTTDDAICLKSTGIPCQNVTVTNCIITSETSAVKFGTSSYGGFRNVTISNCVFHDCQRGAVKLLLVDGGVLENVAISNLVMENVDGPLFIRLGRRGLTYDKPKMMNFGEPAAEDGLRPAGSLRHVLISNIQASIRAGELDKSGIMITGVPGAKIEQVSLCNLQIRFPGRGTLEDARRTVPEDEARYPEQCFFGVLPSYGLYLRHAKGIKLDNVSFVLQEPDRRPAIVCEDVDDLRISNLRLPAGQDRTPLLRLRSAHRIRLLGIEADGPQKVLLQVRGNDFSDISITTDDLRGAEIPIEYQADTES